MNSKNMDEFTIHITSLITSMQMRITDTIIYNT